MKTKIKECTECCTDITDFCDDETMCEGCSMDYWSDYCEICGAEPDELCQKGCDNEKKARCLK